MKHRLRRLRVGAAAVVVVLVAACSGSSDKGGVDLSDTDTSPEQPFVLAGVGHLTQVAQLTGPDGMNDTAKVGVAGTDLGSMFSVADTTYFVFGDTFGERAPDAIGGQGENWRSNALAYTTDDDPSDGITFDGWIVDDIGLAKEVVPGDHEPNGTGEVTKIPTGGFAVGDTMYLAFMSVHYWGDPGEWDANYSGLARSSDDGQNWEVLAAPQWPGDSNFIQVSATPVTEEGEEFIYLWSIPGGRFGGVQLMKVPADTEAVENPDAYLYYAGTDDGAPRWEPDMTAAETIVDDAVGELSVMYSEYLDRWIMTYLNEGNGVVIREGLTPWGPWGESIQVVSDQEYPGLYAPYLNPRYVDDGGRTIYFTLSLWNPYNVFLFKVDLDKRE